jgi:hypothetical protein
MKSDKNNEGSKLTEAILSRQLALVQMIIGITLFPSLMETKEGWINTVCEVVEQHISLESRQLICVANKEKVHFKD